MKRLIGNISTVVMILFLFHSTAHAFNLPDTGQTVSYSAGDNGAYNINPMFYIDNGNGTVTDNNTGLIWQKCSMGQTSDAHCGGTASVYAGDQAATGCGSLNTSNFGGHNDWRLPAKKELTTIVDYSVTGTGPTIDAFFFPGTQQFYYWSSTAYFHDPGYAWYADFTNGNISINPKSGNNYYVRCVRGGQTSQSFSDNSDGTVTDNRTGLMWQKCGPPQDSITCSGIASAYTWSNALDYCNSLNLPATNGYPDWRLPDVKELESVTDDTRFNPAIDTTFFPGNTATIYWASTTCAATSANAWTVSFYGGSILNYGKSGSHYVRCVRGGQGEASYVRLMRGGAPVASFDNIQDAYNTAQAGDVIQTKAVVSTENQTFVVPKSVFLKGGFDNGFTANAGFTVIDGNLTIIGGTVTVENLKIK
jgi:hypothetical protein